MIHQSFLPILVSEVNDEGHMLGWADRQRVVEVKNKYGIKCKYMYIWIWMAWCDVMVAGGLVGKAASELKQKQK
jgi:hypothetical protein